MLPNLENSLHLSTDDFFTKFELLNNKLRVLQINMRSIRNLERFDKLKRFMDKIDLDMVVVTESWLNDVHHKFYGINGFQSFFSGRKDEDRGGGLAVYIKDSLQCDVLKCYDTSFNELWLKITLQDSSLFYLACYYRPLWTDKNLFLMNVELFMSKYSNEKCMIVGDINLDMLQIIPNNSIEYFNNLLSAYNLKLSNNIRTRPSSGKLLDVFLINFCDHYPINNYTIDDDFSDHSLILSEIEIQNLPVTYSEFTSQNKIDFDILCRKLNIFIDTDFSNVDNPNDLYETFITVLQNAITESTFTTNQKRRKKDLLCPWFNAELKCLCQYKHALIRKIRKITDPVLKEYFKLKLRQISNHITVKKRQLKKEYFYNLFSNCDSSFKTWQHINEVLCRKPKKQQIDILHVNDKIFKDDYEKSSQLNKYFVTIASEMSTQFPTTQNINCLSTLESCNSSMYINPCDESEVCELINCLEDRKSPGDDNISGYTLKKIKNLIVPILTIIINLIFTTGIYPDELKRAKVTPVHKKK